jgi:hypothetical protein
MRHNWLRQEFQGCDAEKVKTMTNRKAKTKLKTYRVLYAVTRMETYEVKAATLQRAQHIAFGDGELVETGETTSVTDWGAEEVRSRASQMTTASSRHDMKE